MDDLFISNMYVNMNSCILLFVLSLYGYGFYYSGIILVYDLFIGLIVLFLIEEYLEIEMFIEGSDYYSVYSIL